MGRPTPLQESPPPLPPRLQHDATLSVSSSLPSMYLQELRKITSNVLVNIEPVSSVLDHVKRKFLLPPAKSSWGEECESIVTLLYVAFHYPNSITRLFTKGVTLEFLARWLSDSEEVKLNSVIYLFSAEVKYGLFSVMLLLLSNLHPQELSIESMEECLSWNSEWLPGTSPPRWLLDGIGNTMTISKLKKLLFCSLVFLKGMTSVMIMENSDNLSLFLHACTAYKNKRFEEVLMKLDAIKFEQCANTLQGRILWLTGLTLFKMDKPNTALIKLQSSVDKCSSCVPALFNISKIFNKMALHDAEIETLLLLASIDMDWQPYGTMNFESSLIRELCPPDERISSKAHFLIAAQSLLQKKYEDSCRHLHLLMQMLNSPYAIANSRKNHDTMSDLNEDHLPNRIANRFQDPDCTFSMEDENSPYGIGNSRLNYLENEHMLNQDLPYAFSNPRENAKTLFTLEDSPPLLPKFQILMLLQGLAHFQKEDYESCLAVFVQSGDKDICDSSFYEDIEHRKMDTIVAATSQFIMSEARAKLDETDGALKEFMRLEQNLHWVKPFEHCDWDRCIFQIKILLYSTISHLHSLKNNLDSHNHYKRLMAQNLALLSTTASSPTWDTLDQANELIMKCIFNFLSERLNAIQS